MGEDGVERRTLEASELRVQAGENGSGPVIRGYAAVFGQWSENLGGFREQIRPGAFAKTIREGDVRALWNHDRLHVLGRTKNQTLRLREDDHGLLIEVDPPDSQWAQDAVTSIERGDVDQMSFGFKTIREEWGSEPSEDGEGYEARRTLVEVRLIEVSPVTFAAYPQTTVQVRERVAELQASTPGQEPHLEVGDEEDQGQAPLSLKRRRLELAERMGAQ